MSLETLVIFKVPGGQLYSRKADTLMRLPQLGEKTLIAGTMYEVEDVIYNITPDDGNVQLMNLLGVLAGQSGSNPAAAAAALAKITPLDPGGAMIVTRGFSTPDLVVVVVLGATQPARISLATGGAAAGLGSKSQFAAPDAEATAEAGDAAQS